MMYNELGTFALAVQIGAQLSGLLDYILDFFMKHSSAIFEYIWVPIIVPALGIVIKFTFADRFLYVKELKQCNDPDVDHFAELYNSRIDKALRIEVEHILQYVGRKKTTSIEHHLYVCKKFNKVVGFIKFMISKEHKYIFVAYVAIDKKDHTAINSGLRIMTKKLIKKYFNPNEVLCIIAEGPKTARESYRSSYNMLVARYAKMIGKKCYCVNVPYMQPKMPGECDKMTDEDFLSLLYIPYYEKDNNCISRDELLSLIESIYYEIYAPSCDPSSGRDCNAYNDYLLSIIEMYKTDFKEYVELIPLN